MSFKVMIVDDSRVVHAEMKKLLADTEFEVVATCRSGENALSTYEECHPDVVTMDIVMPGMDGFAAARTIMEKHPEARVLIVSSLAYDDTIDEAVKIGAKGFVFKPINQEQLMGALMGALDRKSVV